MLTHHFQRNSFRIASIFSARCINVNLRTKMRPSIIMTSNFSAQTKGRSFSESITINSQNRKRHEARTHHSNNVKRVWLPNSKEQGEGETVDIPKNLPLYWNRSVDEDLSSMRGVIEKVGAQEREGGRMKEKKLGVLRADPKEDMRLLIENYTVPALASALRDREDALQLCATLLADGKMEELSNVLRPFEQQNIELTRAKRYQLDLTNGFNTSNLEMLRRSLNRMPRRVSQAHQRRAGVVLPLCNVDGIPCILFEKRSANLRAHADEVCLPGGMVSHNDDRSIVATCLREMKEEVPGIDEKNVSPLGVLRCNWGEVHHLVGVAVTPVVCFIGEIGDADLDPNADEVAECFTVPLSLFLDPSR